MNNAIVSGVNIISPQTPNKSHVVFPVDGDLGMVVRIMTYDATSGRVSCQSIWDTSPNKKTFFAQAFFMGRNDFPAQEDVVIGSFARIDRVGDFNSTGSETATDCELREQDSSKTSWFLFFLRRRTPKPEPLVFFYPWKLNLDVGPGGAVEATNATLSTRTRGINDRPVWPTNQGQVQFEVEPDDETPPGLLPLSVKLIGIRQDGSTQVRDLILVFKNLPFGDPLNNTAVTKQNQSLANVDNTEYLIGSSDKLRFVKTADNGNVQINKWLYNNSPAVPNINTSARLWGSSDTSTPVGLYTNASPNTEFFPTVNFFTSGTVFDFSDKIDLGWTIVASASSRFILGNQKTPVGLYDSFFEFQPPGQIEVTGVDTFPDQIVLSDADTKQVIENIVYIGGAINTYPRYDRSSVINPTASGEQWEITNSFISNQRRWTITKRAQNGVQLGQWRVINALPDPRGIYPRISGTSLPINIKITIPGEML